MNHNRSLNPSLSLNPFETLPKVSRLTINLPTKSDEVIDNPWIGQMVPQPETDWPSISQQAEKFEYHFYYEDLAVRSKKSASTPVESTKVVKTKPNTIRVSIDGAWSGKHE
jgi:hypothetical protein